MAKRDHRGYNLKKRYGLTVAKVDLISRLQRNKCIICGEQKPLVVDHCHETKKFRGLLCHNCNTGLGLFKDNIKILRKAIRYLKKHKVI